MPLEPFRYAFEYVWFLCGISGAFWFLSWLAAHLALAIYESLLEEFANLFAIVYNFVLAVLFAGTIALCIVMKGQGSPVFLWHKAAGFVFVYFALSAAYSDPHTHEYNDHSVLGYLAGLGAYLVLASFPVLALDPVFVKVFDAAWWVTHGWVGRLLAFYAVYRFTATCWRIARSKLSLEPRIRLRRHT